MKTTVKLIVALLITNISFGQDFSKKIDSIIKDSYRKNPNIGLSVGFINNDEEYYTAYGTLNSKSPIEINKNSIFEIASVTKILTSNLIAQAVLENKIKIDDYIDGYLPKEYVLHKNLKNKIKISDLASHQSGLPDVDFLKLIELNPQQPISAVTQNTLTTMINTCSELKDYGKYRYSTVGFTLLGQILENIYNKSFDEIIRDQITAPLQMTNTLTTDYNVKNTTEGHNPDGGIQEFLHWNVTAPAGLVKSNASDMVTYLKAVLNEETRIGKAALLTEKTFYKVENRELGLGINIMTDDKNTIYLKTGDSMGHSSIIAYNRTKKCGFILLLNHRNSKMRQELFNTIYEKVLK